MGIKSNRVANQRAICVTKLDPLEDAKPLISHGGRKVKDTFSVTLKSANVEARKCLSGNGYKLYSYFCDLPPSKDSYDWIIYKQELIENSGLQERQYLKAFNELVDNRYLINSGHNNYVFIQRQDKVFYGIAISRNVVADTK